MPLRGSVQLLLLSLDQRGLRRLGFGLAAGTLLVAGLAQLQGTLSSLGKDGFAQTLRQSVWTQVLADQAPATPWPWQDFSNNMSLAPGATVPRLGLSATLGTFVLAEEPASAADDARTQARTASASQPQGDIALGDTAIGGSITFTAADGATCVYQVSGRRVVDPHLTAGEAERLDGEAALFDCSPLETLIIEKAPVVTPGSDQRKL